MLTSQFLSTSTGDGSTLCNCRANSIDHDYFFRFLFLYFFIKEQRNVGIPILETYANFLLSSISTGEGSTLWDRQVYFINHDSFFSAFLDF